MPPMDNKLVKRVLRNPVILVIISSTVGVITALAFEKEGTTLSLTLVFSVLIVSMITLFVVVGFVVLLLYGLAFLNTIADFLQKNFFQNKRIVQSKNEKIPRKINQETKKQVGLQIFVSAIVILGGLISGFVQAMFTKFLTTGTQESLNILVFGELIAIALSLLLAYVGLKAMKS